MLNSSILTLCPLICGLFIAVGWGVMAYKPTLRWLRIGRIIVLAALALAAAIPIYVANFVDATFPGWVIVSFIGGAALGVLTFVFLQWTYEQIQAAETED